MMKFRHIALMAILIPVTGFSKVYSTNTSTADNYLMCEEYGTLVAKLEKQQAPDYMINDVLAQAISSGCDIKM
jgi:hypothetical protein